MKYSIVLHSAPQIESCASTALHFSKALVNAGHDIYRIFLHGDAVLLSSSETVTPQDESSIYHEWQAFIRQHDLDAIVCISSAIKRGILNEEEAARYDKHAPSMATCYTLSGLGQLVDACVHSDRVITFK